MAEVFLVLNTVVTSQKCDTGKKYGKIMI